jgi:hypothetical protein
MGDFIDNKLPWGDRWRTSCVRIPDGLDVRFLIAAKFGAQTKKLKVAGSCDLGLRQVRFDKILDISN